MKYYEDPKFKDILDLYIKGVDELDTQTMRKLAPALKIAQHDMRQQLDKFEDNAFTYFQKRQSLIAIENALQRMNETLEQGFTQQGEKYFDIGQETAFSEVEFLNKKANIPTPDVKKMTLSTQQNEFLLNNMRASLREYTAGVRVQVSNAITAGTLAGKTATQITSSLAKYIDVKKWRLFRIARTEMHKLANESKLLSYIEFNNEMPGLKLMKTIVTPQDKRTAEDSIYFSEIVKPIPLGEPFRYTYTAPSGKKYKRIFQSPPDRPNDRGILVSFSQKWEK